MAAPKSQPRPSPTGSKKQILHTAGKYRAAPFDVEPSTLWLIVGALGVAITVIGWTDLALLWYPLDFGNPEWEFGTISAHLDGMPLGTIGLVALAVGIMGLGWRLPARLLSGLFALITVCLLGVFIVYLLDVPVALGGVAPALLPIIKKAMAKAVTFAMVYLALYGWLSVYLWRKTRVVALPSAVD